MRNRTSKKGITLVETIVACGVITTLMLGTIPPTAKMIRQKVAQTTAQEMIEVQEAEKNYWIDQLNTNGTGQWASSISTLQTAGYLPSTWNAKNLFGNNYTVSTTASTCSVQTIIPKGLEGVVQTHCPQVNVSYSGNNATVSSTIPVPGQEPTMESMLHRTGDARFRIAEEPVGSKKYLVAGTDLTEVENEIKAGLEEKPDIYIKELKTQGISKSGWLSDAKFKPPKGRYTGDSVSIEVGVSQSASVTARMPGGSDSLLTKTSGSVKVSMLMLPVIISAECFVTGDTPLTEVWGFSSYPPLPTPTYRVGWISAQLIDGNYTVSFFPDINGAYLCTGTYTLKSSVEGIEWLLD
ncbi:MAG TPA: hypothetical protein P5150_01505 [Candidatus Ratteibacteria bacterium]|nr:hypothetical protein [Candidatus Ratteibacteria bacterium]